MAENDTGVSPAALKKTKATLGSIITKPPLTDKLLQRPPFKYLHDIITEVSCIYSEYIEILRILVGYENHRLL